MMKIPTVGLLYHISWRWFRFFSKGISDEFEQPRECGFERINVFKKETPKREKPRRRFG